MLIRPSGFFKVKTLPPSSNQANDTLITKIKSEQSKVRQKCENETHRKSELPQRISVANGFATFTKHYKHFRSHMPCI